MFKTAIMKFGWLVCMAVLVMVSGCAEESDDNGAVMLAPADLLPGDDDISGWGGIGAYEEANDYDGLYDIINGGAEVYIDEGFVSAAFQIYENCIGEVCSVALVHLRIYDQGNSENARAVYDKVSTGIGIPWDGAGVEARVDESALAAYVVEFWEENFFVQVVIEEKTDESLNIAKLFASHVSSEIR
jgi:hypothetical protein